MSSAPLQFTRVSALYGVLGVKEGVLVALSPFVCLLTVARLVESGGDLFFGYGWEGMCGVSGL